MLIVLINFALPWLLALRKYAFCLSCSVGEVHLEKTLPDEQ